MKPNILFICADQFRADTLSCVGHPDIKTPHLDALAADGCVFPNAYSPNPICVPGRATMITGRYSHKCTGNKDNGGTIKDDEIKLPQLLADNGYATYSSGKLHYLPYVNKNNQEPTLHGFQKAVLAESGRMLKQFDEKNEQGGVEDYMDYLETVGYKGYSRAHGIGNNDIHPAASPLPAEHTVDAWVASQAINYMDEHIKDAGDKPFFIHASFPKPHSPYDPPRPYDQIYDPRHIQKPAVAEEPTTRSTSKIIDGIAHGWQYLSPEAVQVARAHYYGLITFQDEQIGRLVQHLKDNDLYDNTIILFTADHGDMMGDFGFFFKACMYEGSCAIPFVFKAPGKAKNNVNPALVGLQDIVPTLLDLVDIPLPRDVDGISFVPELEDSATQQREYIVSYSLRSPHQCYMIRDEQYKYLYSEANGLEELYDLKTDPRELKNIIESEAEIAKRLKDKMLEWIIENEDNEMLQDGQLVSTAVDAGKAEFRAGSMGWRWY